MVRIIIAHNLMKKTKRFVKNLMYKIWHGKNSGPKRKLDMEKESICKNLIKMKKNKLKNLASLQNVHKIFILMEIMLIR